MRNSRCCKHTSLLILFFASQDYWNQIIKSCIAFLDDENKDEIGGIAGLVLECIRSCNSDVRPLVVQNILCVGGGSMIPGTYQEHILLLIWFFDALNNLFDALNDLFDALNNLFDALNNLFDTLNNLFDALNNLFDAVITTIVWYAVWYGLGWSHDLVVIYLTYHITSMTNLHPTIVSPTQNPSSLSYYIYFIICFLIIIFYHH